jgi:hypothetical protein
MQAQAKSASRDIGFSEADQPPRCLAAKVWIYLVGGIWPYL